MGGCFGIGPWSADALGTAGGAIAGYVVMTLIYYWWHRWRHEVSHWYNFSDLPLWDMMFGTFRNPRRWDATCGLGPENEHRLAEMLGGVDLRIRSRVRASV